MGIVQIAVEHTLQRVYGGNQPSPTDMLVQLVPPPPTSIVQLPSVVPSARSIQLVNVPPLGLLSLSNVPFQVPTGPSAFAECKAKQTIRQEMTNRVVFISLSSYKTHCTRAYGNRTIFLPLWGLKIVQWFNITVYSFSRFVSSKKASTEVSVL